MTVRDSVSAFDRELDALVRPVDHRNPTPAPRYDLVVLGGGTAGLVAAAGAAGLGARVALVERGRLGGDCLNAGCVPSKALLATAERAARIGEASRLAISVDGYAVRFPEAMERLRARRAAIAHHDSVGRFRELGVDVFLGAGRFAARREIRVGESVLHFRRAVIATGSRPVVPAIPGLREAGFLTNETIFDLTELPPRLAVLGGGPVGSELAQAFARLGSRVTLIVRDDRILPREEGEAATIVQARFVADGIDLRLGTTLESVERRDRGLALTVRRHGVTSTIEAETLLVATGRTPDLDGLDLAAAGVALSDGRIAVDDRLRTTNRSIFVAGDADGRLPFTHAADAMSRIVLRNALFPGPGGRHSALVVPRATYTDPEIAAIGASASELEAAGRTFRTITVRFDQVDRAILQESAEGYARIHAESGRGTILGATIVGEGAGELIGEVAVAMAGGVTLGRLANVIHPYPTRAEILRKAGDAWNRERLTPAVRRLFALWFRATGVGRG